MPDGTGAALAASAGIWMVQEVRQWLNDIFPTQRDRIDRKLTDWLDDRAERRESFRSTVAEAAVRRRLRAPTKPAPVNVLYPLLEAAVLEDDEKLREHWAQMLLNAVDAESKAEVRRAYVSILGDLKPLDALNLSKLYGVKPGTHGRLARTAKLPDEALPYYEGHGDPACGLPPPHVVRSLWNLVRLGLVSYANLASGDEHLINVSITALGIGLVEAITSPSGD